MPEQRRETDSHFIQSLIEASYEDLEFDHKLDDSIPPRPSAEVIQKFLSYPLIDCFERPSKKFRAQLVRMGSLAGQAEHKEPRALNEDDLLQLESLIELIHLGSLVIDDVQDASETRRGAPTLHRTIGPANAINVGNFAYFRALSGISRLNLKPETAFELSQYLIDRMSEAHAGQAIDLNANLLELDAKKIQEVCSDTRRYKTGSICAMAFGAGYILSSSVAPWPETEALVSGLGCLLQMYDDIGNLKADFAKDKSFEDLDNVRPSWIWQTAAGLARRKRPHLLTSLRGVTQSANEARSNGQKFDWQTWPELVLAQEQALLAAAQVEAHWREDLEQSDQINQDTKIQFKTILEKVRGSYGHTPEKRSDRKKPSELETP